MLRRVEAAHERPRVPIVKTAGAPLGEQRRCVVAVPEARPGPVSMWTISRDRSDRGREDRAAFGTPSAAPRTRQSRAADTYVDVFRDIARYRCRKKINKNKQKKILN